MKKYRFHAVAALLMAMAYLIFAGQVDRSPLAENPAAAPPPNPAMAAATVSATNLSTQDTGKPASRPPPPVPVVAIQEQIAVLLRTEVAGLTDMHSILSYLDELEARASARGEVTALEVETGLAAIAQIAAEHGPDKSVELAVAFEKRMQQLSQRLRRNMGQGPQDEDPLSGIKRLKQQIAENTGKKQQEDIQQYLILTGSLEPQAQIASIRELEALLNTLDSRRIP